MGSRGGDDARAVYDVRKSLCGTQLTGLQDETQREALILLTEGKPWLPICLHSGQGRLGSKSIIWDVI